MSYIPKCVFDRVVVLGHLKQGDNLPTWVGTGAFLANVVQGEQGEEIAHYLVTAKHVVTGYTHLYLAMPNGQALALQLIVGGQPVWRSPANNSDIALAPLPVNIVAHITHSFRSTSTIGTVHWLNANNIREGVQLFVLGPMIEHSGGNINVLAPYTKIAKGALLSYGRDTLVNVSVPFLCDGFVWHGWSGSPVVAVEPMDDQEPVVRLVGVTGSYTPYAEILKSPLTGAMTVLQYNSGLFKAAVIDNALDAIELF